MPGGDENKDPIGKDAPEDIAKDFVETKESELYRENKSLEQQQDENKDLLGQSGKVPGWNSDPDSIETERYVNDVFIKDQKDKIRRMEDAIKILGERQSILDENGEVSSRRFGDIILGYKIEFPGVDGTKVQENLNIILVPSALVGNGEFRTEVQGKEMVFTVVSPVSEVGKRIVKSSL